MSQEALSIQMWIGLQKGSDSHSMIFDVDVVLLFKGLSAMAAHLRLSSLAPSGLIVESIAEEARTLFWNSPRARAW